MTSISFLSGRVPNRLGTLITQQSISSANLQLLQSQVQLSSGKRILRTSDDPVGSALVNVLQGRLASAERRDLNLSHAESVLGYLDTELANISDAAGEAKTIALSQIGVGSDAATRSAQGVVVSSLIDGVVASLNSDYAGISLFGGSRTGSSPIEPFFGGYRYRGSGQGLYTDLGPGLNFPITIGADEAVGALSARVQGSVDLNRVLTDSTKITDLRGPGGEIESLGTLNIVLDDGTPPALEIPVDLSQATTTGDVANAIESAIRTADPAAFSGAAYPAGVSFVGDRFSIGTAGAPLAAGYSVTFSDAEGGTSARDLGLDGFTFDPANQVSTVTGRGLNPAITDQTSFDSLFPGTPVSYGTITFRNGGRTGSVTIAPGTTIAQFKEDIERLNLGIRAEISDTGDGLNIINEVSGFKLSVEETGGGTTASTLGIRTLDRSTAVSEFNHGRGVTIAHGQVDSTGAYDTNRNTDFRVTLASGASFDVDLVPDDLNSVQAVLDRVNAAAATAGLGGQFVATLNAAGTGIEFQDSSVGAGQLGVSSLNGYAATDLGLLDGTFTAGVPNRLVGSERTSVRVDSLLTTLQELRTALEGNDTIGIEIAGERLETDSDTPLQARAKVGGRQARAIDARERIEDTKLLDESIKSSLYDLDYIEATSRFNLLQTQLEAGLQTAAAIRSLSLLDFLG